jgi:hypothetical protein
MAPVLPLRIVAREHRGATLVKPVGVLDITTYAQLRDALIKYAADEPAAVIVDVGELAVPSPYSLTVFTSVWIQITEWPGVPLLLLATEPGRRAQLAASAIGRYMPVTRDLEAAMRAVGAPPPRRRTRLTLPHDPISSATVRQVVRLTCDRWGIDSVVEDATAIATELVENVIQHTTSTPDLRLDLRNGLFTVAVADDDPRPAVLKEAVVRATPSAGLALVAHLSQTWGCTPTGDGKIVWAVLRAN